MSINSSSISPVIYLLFIFSFTVLFTIAKHAILSLEDGSPFFFGQLIRRPTLMLDKELLLQDFHLLWCVANPEGFASNTLGYASISDAATYSKALVIILLSG